MTGDEDQLVILGAGSVPFQIIRTAEGFVVLIDAKEGHIEVVAGIGEIVIIAAPESDLALGGHDQADVGVAFVLIEPVFTAVVQGDHIAAEAGLVAVLLFNFRLFLFAGLEGVSRLHPRLDRAGDPAGDIHHIDEHVQLQIRAFGFLRLGGGVKTGRDEILLGRRHFLQLSHRHMVVGHHQAVGADERARAAVHEADARQADVIQPLLGGGEVVFFLQLFGRGVVKSPHPFIGCDQRCREEQDDRQGGADDAVQFYLLYLVK